MGLEPVADHLGEGEPDDVVVGIETDRGPWVQALIAAGYQVYAVLARTHQNLIWSRQRQANLLRSTLREFFPAALAAFDELHGRDAFAVLDLAPTPVRGRALSRAKIASALQRVGRRF